MTYSETAAVIYRILNAYPSQARLIDKPMIENMIREWHEGMKNLPADGVMEAVTALCTESKWMPSLSEIITKILDIQYGTEDDIIRGLDKAIQRSSNCIIFGRVTEEQEQGYKRLTPFQKLIIHSPADFNLWLNKDHEWKAEQIKRIKREVSYGRHKERLMGREPEQVGFNVFKALEERKHGQDQQPR